MEVLIIVALTLLNGFFAGAEIALLSVRKTRLQELAASGHRGAAAALALRAEPERFLATVQVGITVVGASAATLGGTSLAGPLAEQIARLGLPQLADELAFGLVVGGISVLSVVLGELVPKSLSLRASERVSLIAARPLQMLAALARPVVWLLTQASNAVLRPFDDQTSFTEGMITPDELQRIVEDAGEAGAVPAALSDIASRAIELTGVHVGVVMIPRQLVVGIERGMTKDEIWRRLRDYPHARYPVFASHDGAVDGYVTMRDISVQLVECGGIDLDAALRSAPHFSEQQAAIDVLRQLQESSGQLGIVIDEYGTFAGIVTTEDITEELVGDLLAEDETPETKVRQAGPGAYLVKGTLSVHELNRELSLDLPLDPSYATVAGLMIHTAGRLLRSGESVMLTRGVEAIVREATSRQVRLVEVVVREPPGSAGP